MMRVLTVRQPWAWAIVHGGKDIENRSRNLAGSYRGPVAIHAGLTLDDDGVYAPTIAAARARVVPADPGDHSHDYRFGVVIGVVDLTDVHGPASARCCGSRWAEEGAMHLLLENPRPLRVTVPAVGRLGLWTADTELEQAIRGNLPT